MDPHINSLVHMGVSVGPVVEAMKGELPQEGFYDESQMLLNDHQEKTENSDSRSTFIVPSFTLFCLFFWGDDDVQSENVVDDSCLSYKGKREER